MGALLMLRTPLLVLCLCLVSACSNLSYYLQASHGHLELIKSRKNIDRVVSSLKISPASKEKLHLVQQVTHFAEHDLGLPVGGAYSDYVEVDGPYVVWNVFASQRYSFENKQWCYPLLGCVSYKGFFDVNAATRYGKKLEQEGFDVYVGGVAAYSTLGWFDDPVLSTFLMREDYQLAALIFHELAHRVLYINGDTTFNESFASAVEQIALERWVEASSDPDLLTRYNNNKALNKAFVNFVLGWKGVLQKAYHERDNREGFEKQKEQLYKQMRADYERFKARVGYNGYDDWVNNDLNNAKINTVATYESRVPGFKKMYRQAGEDMAVFLRQCLQLSRMPALERNQYLDEIMLALPQLNQSGNSPASNKF